MAGLFALMIAGFAGLAAATGWAETWDALSALTFGQLLLLLALSVVNYLFRALRWHLFTRQLGLGIAATVNALHFLAGFAMSATPGRVGELVRMRWIRRETGWSFDRTAPLVLIDRAADLAAMGAILAAALAASAAGIAGGLPVAILALAAAWVVTRPALLGWMATRAHRALGVLPRLFARVRRASRSLAAFRGTLPLAVALALGITGWMAEAWAFHLLLGWMGADVALSTAIAIFVFATLAGGLTGAPGGLGGAEAAMIALLLLEGVPAELSIPATLIIRVTTLWFAIGIGFALFPVAERQSLKGSHAQ